MDSVLKSIRASFVPIHREGYPFIVIFAFLALFVGWLWAPLFWVGAVLTLAAVFVLSSGRKVLAHVDDHDPAPHSVDEALAVTVGD